ncbi:MAG: hypothetical protein QF793_04410, partial [Candidatus Peribacteraceae bacterium]|nr:hypothetical protein [Candidatus Peribacteraceae bacterium]
MRCYTIFLYAGLYILIAALVYGQVLTFDFVALDDGLLIYHNETVQGFSLAHVKEVFTSYDPELYIPLTLLSYMLDYTIGGTEPFVYHLQNLVWHILNSLLVGLFVFVLFCRGAEADRRLRVWGAALCGLLFLVHPINSEAA